MEGSVSNVEICNLAYTGELEELKKCVLSDRSLVTKTDQVCRKCWYTCAVVSMMLSWSLFTESKISVTCLKCFKCGCCLIQDSRTALHWACSAGHVDIVQFLLNLGVEVNLQDDVSQHCFMIQSRSYALHQWMLLLLKKITSVLLLLLSNAFISAVNAWLLYYVVKCIDSKCFVIHCMPSWWSSLPFYIIPGMLDSPSYSSICWERRNCQILNIQRSSVELCEPEWLYATTLRSI